MVPKRLLLTSNPAAAEGSPVQGELSRLAVTEGLVLTNTIERIESTLPSFSCENATAPCTGEAIITAAFLEGKKNCNSLFPKRRTV